MFKVGDIIQIDTKSYPPFNSTYHDKKFKVIKVGTNFIDTINLQEFYYGFGTMRIGESESFNVNDNTFKCFKVINNRKNTKPDWL